MSATKTKKELNKEKIQQAAFKCVARYGFEKTTLDDIAKEVGLNKASLYYYYKNKEEIFLDITTNATRQFLETLQSSTLAIVGNVVEKIRHFLYERAMYYVRMVEQTHITEETLRQVEHLFWEQIRDVEAKEQIFLQGLLNEAVANGSIKATDTPRLAQILALMGEAIKSKAKENHPDLRDTRNLASSVEANLSYMLGLIFDGLWVQSPFVPH
jgi:TetR/AcrR family transcriptional regulator, biofilm operon repressor